MLRIDKRSYGSTSKKIAQKCVQVMVVCSAMVLGACSSQPTSKPSLQPLPLGAKAVLLTQQKVKVSPDGVQDIAWKIVQIKQQRANFYQQVPSLMLNSAVKTVSGHTGCNSIFGRYEMNSAQKTVDLTVQAGHQSCDGALAQEADLVDALQRVERFQLSVNQLLLQDKMGQTLIQAQKK